MGYRSLHPVNFEYKDYPGIKQYGLIAEEVDAVNQAFVIYNDEGAPEAVTYSELVTPLLKALQEHERRLDELTIDGGEGGNPIAGETVIGDLIIDGDLDISGTLKASSLWAQNAAWHLTSEGDLYVQEVDTQNLKTEDIEIADGQDKATGASVLPAGRTEIEIGNASVTDRSYILLTIGHARAEAKEAITGSIKIKTVNGGQNFVVGTADNQPTDKDIPFSYLIVN